MEPPRETWVEAIAAAGRQWGVPVDRDACGRILVHWNLVQEARDRMNLTSLAGEAALYRLVVDSLSALWAYRGEAPSVDIGSGAGYPGLVLAAVYPQAEWTLVEARAKRAAFLRDAVEALELRNVRVVAGRAEVLGREERERYRFAVVRAVGPLPLVMELALPLLEVGGRLLAMRGPEGTSEIVAAEGALAALGGAVTGHDAFELPRGHGRRVLLLVEKRWRTPERYPRRGGSLGRFARTVAGQTSEARG